MLEQRRSAARTSRARLHEASAAAALDTPISSRRHHHAQPTQPQEHQDKKLSKALHAHVCVVFHQTGEEIGGGGERRWEVQTQERERGEKGEREGPGQRKTPPHAHHPAQNEEKRGGGSEHAGGAGAPRH